MIDGFFVRVLSVQHIRAHPDYLTAPSIHAHRWDFQRIQSFHGAVTGSLGHFSSPAPPSSPVGDLKVLYINVLMVAFNWKY